MFRMSNLSTANSQRNNEGEGVGIIIEFQVKKKVRTTHQPRVIINYMTTAFWVQIHGAASTNSDPRISWILTWYAQTLPENYRFKTSTPL